jgi:hypothetical protein
MSALGDPFDKTLGYLAPNEICQQSVFVVTLVANLATISSLILRSSPNLRPQQRWNDMNPTSPFEVLAAGLLCPFHPLAGGAIYRQRAPSNAWGCWG